jgi:DnaD/phage-associated family protein
LIRYNPETRELAIKTWGDTNFDKAGKPMMDCILSELKNVRDSSLIPFVLESVQKMEFRNLYESFCKIEEFTSSKEVNELDENNTYIAPQWKAPEATFSNCPSIDRQEDKEEENQQVDVKEIIEFWDKNGFGYTNVNAKEQLLSWLDDSGFLHPKAVILKALNIACANNKRRLSYVVGILKNWQNESLLSVEEIDDYQENQKTVSKYKKATESVPGGRYIPRGFDLDITDGEDW